MGLLTKVSPSKLAKSTKKTTATIKKDNTATTKTTRTTSGGSSISKSTKLPASSKVGTTQKAAKKAEAQKKATKQNQLASTLGFDSSSLNPLHQLQRDAATGTTVRDKITYAKTTGAASSAKNNAKTKEENEAIKTRQTERKKKNAAQTLSKEDRKLTKRDQTLIRDAKTAYDQAKEQGDTEAMARAHQRAENVRNRHGYSGGVSGNEKPTTELTNEEKAKLNDAGEKLLRVQKFNLKKAQDEGNKEKISAVETLINSIMENNAYRDRAYKATEKTTGNNTTMDAGVTETVKEFIQNADAGLTAAAKGVVGSIPSLVETSAKATDNLVRENNKEDLQKWANNLGHYKFLLEWLQSGHDVNGETESSLQQKIRIAQNAKDLLESSVTVDSSLPGQTLMRESSEAAEKFLEGKTGASRLLGQAALSTAQMVPALAAGALVPGAGAAVATGIMSAQAAGQKAFELNERNVDPAEAQARGILSGGIEALTEKIPVESLLKVVKAGGGTSMLRNVAKQAGLEATEESASYVLNYLADKAAKDPEAKFSLQELAESAAIGAISGGALAGGATAVNRLTGNSAQQVETSRAEQAFSNAVGRINEQAKNTLVDVLNRRRNQAAQTESEAAQPSQTAQNPAGTNFAAEQAQTPGRSGMRVQSEEDGASVPIKTGTLAGNPSDTETPSYFSDIVAQDAPAVNVPESEEPPNNVIQFPGNLPEGMGAMSSGGAGEFANWQSRSESFHPINESAAATTAEQRGRAATEIPTRNLEGRLTSKVISTFANANILPNEMVTAIEANLADGAYSRLRYTDAAALEGAEYTIRDMGFQAAKEHWLTEVASGRINKSNSVLGIALINHAANSPGLHIDAMDLLSRYVDFSRDASQALQSVNMINKLSPQGQLYTLIKSVEYMEERANKNRETNPVDVELNPELTSAFMSAETQAERDRIKQDIIRDVAAQLPSTWRDRFDAWRYLSMLGNPRTHIRNMFGNAGFSPFRGVKNVLGTTMEKVSGTENRTKSILSRFSKEDRARLAIARGEFGEVEELIKSGGKYIDDYSRINMERDVWKSENKLLNALGKPISKLSDLNSELLDKEDMIFAKPAYAGALAGYLKANGVTAEQYARMKEAQRNTPVEAEVAQEEITLAANGSRRKTLTAKQLLKNGDAAGFVEQAQAYAIKEAQKATYRDTNDFSEAISAISKMRNSENKIVRNVLSPLAEGVLPFKKTPANILVRTLEYSPFGLAKGIGDAVISNRADSWLNAEDPGKGLRKKIYDMKQNVASGAKTPAEAIDEIAAGLSGTGLVGLGMLLGYMGIAAGGASDDEKQNDFDSLQGHQNYAIEIGDRSFTLDWLAPEALPFFVGVELQKAMESMQEGTLTVDDLTSALGHIAEPMLEMSMLQGLNDLFDTMGSDYALSAAAWTAATSYLTQFLPTLGGQIERTMEDTRQTTFVDKESGVPTGLQYLLGNIGNKIPGWEYNQTDYLDEWGRTQSTGTVLNRVLNNFLNPSYTSTINTTDVETELQRLYDAGYDGMFPTAVQRSSEIDGKRVTADQWSAWQTEKGQSAYNALKNFIGTDEYKNLSDDQKAKFVEKVYDYASASGKVAAGGDAEDASKWIQAAENAGSVGLSKEKFISMYAYKSSLENELEDDEYKASVKQGIWEQYINGRSDLSDEQKNYVKENVRFWQMTPADAGSYNKAVAAGYSDPEEITQLIDGWKAYDFDNNGSRSNVELYGYITAAGDTAEQQKMWDALKPTGTEDSLATFKKKYAAKYTAVTSAKKALDSAVSSEKQEAFTAATSGIGTVSQKKIKKALLSVDATDAERIAYYNFVKAKQGWKKSWYQVKM